MKNVRETEAVSDGASAMGPSAAIASSSSSSSSYSTFLLSYLSRIPRSSSSSFISPLHFLSLSLSWLGKGQEANLNKCTVGRVSALIMHQLEQNSILVNFGTHHSWVTYEFVSRIDYIGIA